MGQERLVGGYRQGLTGGEVRGRPRLDGGQGGELLLEQALEVERLLAAGGGRGRVAESARELLEVQQLGFEVVEGGGVGRRGCVRAVGVG
ncbi:MAG: hypothetical protein CMJ84_08875 [Planctomycetes bacterium]|nr:hypothetical protein [Planctomycetota bacterium]